MPAKFWLNTYFYGTQSVQISHILLIILLFVDVPEENFGPKKMPSSG
jgi:hypothetical protein